MYLVLVDAHSKWLDVQIMHSTTPSETLVLPRPARNQRRPPRRLKDLIATEEVTEL